jgi:hypothetical protein
MRPVALLLLGAILLMSGGCAARSRSDSAPEGLQKIEIRFTDFEMQQDTVSRAQPVITVTPVLELTNPNDIPVTFVKVEVDLKGSPELVQLDRNTWPVDKMIPPGARIQHRINIFATLRTGGRRTVQLSPLYVSGRAFFRTARGDSFSQGFVKQQRSGESGDDS